MEASEVTGEQVAEILQGITDLNMTAAQLQTGLGSLQILLAILSGIVLAGFLIGILYDMWRH